MKRTLIVDHYNRPVGVIAPQDNRFRFTPLQPGRNVKIAKTPHETLPAYVNRDLMRTISIKAGQSIDEAIASYTLQDAVEAMHHSKASIVQILTAYHKKYGLGHFSC